MKIGVLSDTHLTRVNEALRWVIEDVFKDADMILHAGDIVSSAVLTYLESENVIAVCGNIDQGDVSRDLPPRRVIEAGGFKIGLMHGWGGPQGLAQRVRQEFGKLDCLVFGHSHQAMNEKVGDELIFNPGSMTESRFSNIQTVGMLTVDEEISGEIINLN